jgi:hypothetical protein
MRAHRKAPYALSSRGFPFRRHENGGVSACLCTEHARSCRRQDAAPGRSNCHVVSGKLPVAPIIGVVGQMAGAAVTGVSYAVWQAVASMRG